MLKRLALAVLFMFVASSAWAVDCQYQATRPTLPNQQFIILQCDPTGNLLVAPTPYSSSQTAISGNATGTTGAVVGTLAAATGKTTYICGFDVSAIGGTAAVGPITVAGTNGASLVYELASSVAGVTLSRTFTPCIPASAANTAITVTTTADGTATAVAVNSWGFQQ
jgi:hypothetical protein